MLPRVWMEGEEEDAASWTKTNDGGGGELNNNNNNNNNEEEEEDHMMAVGVGGGGSGSLSSFKSMLEGDWYLNPPPLHNQDINGFSASASDHGHGHGHGLLLHPIDSSASCSPSQAFNATSLDHTHLHFFPPKPPSSSSTCFSSLLLNNTNTAFDPSSGFDQLACDSAFFAPFQHHSNPNPNSNSMGFAAPAPAPDLMPLSGGFEGFEAANATASALFLNRPKVLRPLDVFPPVGAQPTLFQKRAALRHNSGPDKLGNLDISGARFGDGLESVERKRRKSSEEGEVDEASIDVSALNYDSDDPNYDYTTKMDDSGKIYAGAGATNSNANSSVTGVDQKGKKKGLPAKNLMAERRRRKKLNDRLYMLRSVVPKISKMDRASILGDAIDYLKELLQRINDLHNELESNPSGSLMPPSSSFHPLTPTPPTLPCRVKEELFPGSLPSPKNQPARVEVRLREGRAVNIHMFCARRPGLLLSTMRALDNLGLDIQQAVISCFNGFALDVFRAEQCREGQEVLPEQIKAVLLDSAGFHAMM